MTLLPVQVDRGSGRAIVLLHGLGNNYRSWTFVLEHLKHGQRVIALDLLGFGDAPKPDLEYTPTAHAEAVIETLDSLGLTEVVLAGHSMGCNVAAAVADLRPDLVARLVLLGAPTFKRVRNRTRRFRIAEDRYSAIFTLISELPEVTQAAADAVDRFAPLIKGMEITDETWPAFRSSLRNTVMQTETYRVLRGIRTPTLLVYGRLDVFVIKRNLKSIARHNRRHVRYDVMLGPHEITPVHGEKIAELLHAEVARVSPQRT